MHGLTYLLTYLTYFDEGGETLFPAADGAMPPDEALRLDGDAARHVGLAVRPSRGSALLFYNHLHGALLTYLLTYLLTHCTACEAQRENLP